jgi:hypothetical protein
VDVTWEWIHVRMTIYGGKIGFVSIANIDGKKITNASIGRKKNDLSWFYEMFDL